jgi:Carboxypeptidase regulatory-like domain
MKKISLIFGLLCCAAIGFGQTGLATVTGTITDSSGASVANAPIEVRNLENGVIFKAASSDTGNFTISQLPIGDYDLTVTVPGFKAYSHTKFHLSAAQNMREDVSLQVGANTESVTISADASLLKTESSELANNVTLAQLNNLPILAVGSTNSGFRDPFSAVRLVPGVRYNNGVNVAAGATSAVTTMVVNGTPANTYGTRLDGMTMNPTGPRLLGAQMQSQPSVDAIEEVAIQTSNFAAEFGAAGGAMINMITKSGTNNFHGTAYDYGTNEALNAAQPYLGLKNKIRQNDYGFTIGGPLWIPKVYNGHNRSFFFFSWEQFRQTSAVNASVSVPTDLYRKGDFSSLITTENRLVNTASGPAKDAFGNTIQSGTIFDPGTQRVVNGLNQRDAFPGNKIPVTSFDPIAVKILALIPGPQGVNFAKGLVANNYTGTYDTSRHSNIPSFKFDQIFGKGRLSFYFQDTSTITPRTPTGADPFPNSITGGVQSYSSGQTWRLNYDHTLTARLLLHVGIGMNTSDFGLESPLSNYDAQKELGLVGQTEARYFPRIVTGVNASDGIGGLSPLGTLFPTLSYERRPSATASATYVTGEHTIKLGADWRYEKFPNKPRSSLTSNTTGTYNFLANMTQQPSLQSAQVNSGFQGYEFASFLLGGVSSTTQWAPVAYQNEKSQSALFLQDTWKINRKLTFDYGVRWDYGTYPREQYGRNGSIGLAIPNPSASGRLGATQFESTCKCQFASNYPYAIGPRLGVAYQINAKTVLRAGFGVVYNSTANAAAGVVANGSSTTVATGSGQIIGLFKDGMPASARAVWPSFDPAVGQGPGSVIAFPQLLDQNSGRPARLTQWNISLQRELNRNLVVEASYVGNRGVWWSAGLLGTLNALSQDTLKSFGFNDLTSSTDAALLNGTLATALASPTGRAALAAHGIGLPYANFPTAQTVRQSLLSFPQYTGTGLTSAPLGNTWYDSFQLNMTERFAHGLSFNLNYNFSKNMDDYTGIVDVFNRGTSKNYTAFDRPHALRFTAQYVVPRIHSDRAFLKNKVVSYALADWGIGTYLNYESAPMLTRPTNTSTLTQFLGRGPAGAQLKKTADGSYMSPWSVDWTDNGGTHHTDPLDINCHCFDPTKTVVFNPAAWENVPAGQWGDQQGLRFYRGIRLPQENMNFSRNFRIKEGVSLNLRLEFNNIFNRLQLPTPVGGAVSALAPASFSLATSKFATGANAGLYQAGFGTFTAAGSSILTNGTLGQRIGTFVIRLQF